MSCKPIEREVVAQPAAAPLLISVGEVAKLTNLGERTVWRMSACGQMPAPLRVGGRRLWRVADLQAWIAAGCPELSSRG